MEIKAIRNLANSFIVFLSTKYYFSIISPQSSL